MRTSGLLLLTTALAIASSGTLGCGTDEDGDDLSQQLRGRTGSGAKGDDSALAEGDDGEPSIGENQADTGNPAADAKPNAPATQGTPSSAFGLKLGNATPTVNLGEKVDVDVTLEPMAGFNGSVELTVSGLSDGVTAAPVTVAAGANTAKLSLVAAYTAIVTPKDKNLPIVITGKSGAMQATANATFKVAPKVTIKIPMNIDALRAAAGGPLRAEWGAPFGPQGQALRTQQGNGIVVSIFNSDSKRHIIHGPGGAFPHGDTGNPIQPGAYEMQGGNVRTRTLNVGASATAYPHDGANGQKASFNVKVQAGTI